jgi:hypothetical protein
MPTTLRLFTLNRLAIEPSTAWYLNDLGELRVGEQKREMVIKGIAALLAKPGSAFKISALEQACPGVSRDMIRHVLREQQSQGIIGCSGRGAGANWSRGGAWGGNKGNE